MLLEKSEKYDFLLQGAWTIAVKVGHFQWFWLGTTKKALFWHISSILAMKGPQTWQNSLITWKYYGKTPIEKKNWGSFVHRGLRYEFLRKKIWTVPLILQFNISVCLLLQGSLLFKKIVLYKTWYDSFSIFSCPSAYTYPGRQIRSRIQDLVQGCIIVFGAWDPKFLAWKYA